MAKPEWAICQLIKGSEPIVVTPFTKREDCALELTKRRLELAPPAKWEIIMLPLGKKGEPLLPPGVKL